MFRLPLTNLQIMDLELMLLIRISGHLLSQGDDDGTGVLIVPGVGVGQGEQVLGVPHEAGDPVVACRVVREGGEGSLGELRGGEGSEGR